MLMKMHDGGPADTLISVITTIRYSFFFAFAVFDLTETTTGDLMMIRY
jgi:hypothetical protein